MSEETNTSDASICEVIEYDSHINKIIRKRAWKSEDHKSYNAIFRNSEKVLRLKND